MLEKQIDNLVLESMNIKDPKPAVARHFADLAVCCIDMMISKHRAENMEQI